MQNRRKFIQGITVASLASCALIQPLVSITRLKANKCLSFSITSETDQLIKANVKLSEFIKASENGMKITDSPIHCSGNTLKYKEGGKTVQLKLRNA